MNIGVFWIMLLEMSEKSKCMFDKMSEIAEACLKYLNKNFIHCLHQNLNCLYCDSYYVMNITTLKLPHPYTVKGALRCWPKSP